jgi:hypothetical protein
MSSISFFQGERIRIWSVRARERERESSSVHSLRRLMDSLLHEFSGCPLYIFLVPFFFLPIWFDTFLEIGAWIGSFSLLGSFLVFASIASLNALPSALLWPALFCGEPRVVSLDPEFIVTVLVPIETQKRPSCEVPEKGRWKVSDSRPSFLPFLRVIRHRR